MTSQQARRLLSFRPFRIYLGNVGSEVVSSMDTLALLIPAFNAVTFLSRLLRSATEQTTKFDQIIVYDDCSTDDTASVAASLGAQVLRGDVNRGCSYGKNELAKLTRCTWVHFHDVDDELKPGFVEAAHNWMEKRSHDVVLFAYEARDNATGALKAIRTFDADQLAKDPISYSIREVISPFCGLYRVDRFLAAGGYDTDPNVLYNEDSAMHINLAIHGLTFTADNSPLVINWQRPDSMSSANERKCAVARYYVLKKAANAAPIRCDAVIAEQLWKAATVAASMDEWRVANSAAYLAARHGPPPPGLFRWLSAASPRMALRVRETLIRVLKPHHRRQVWPWTYRHAKLGS